MPKTLLTGADEESVSIRKIENGWIISRTLRTSRGKNEPPDFKTTETFTAEKPDLKID